MIRLVNGDEPVTEWKKMSSKVTFSFSKGEIVDGYEHQTYGMVFREPLPKPYYVHPGSELHLDMRDTGLLGPPWKKQEPISDLLDRLWPLEERGPHEGAPPKEESCDCNRTDYAGEIWHYPGCSKSAKMSEWKPRRER